MPWACTKNAEACTKNAEACTKAAPLYISKLVAKTTRMPTGATKRIKK